MPPRHVRSPEDGRVHRTEHVLELLLQDPAYAKVIALCRHRLTVQNSKLEQIVVDFDELQTLTSSLHVDDVFCSLGTTIKKAGSREAFWKVDFEYVVNVARFGLSLGARGFYVVSSMGANPQSRAFYLRVKGEMEEAVKALGYPSIGIFKPSLIAGRRRESRLGERVALWLAKLISPLLVGPPKKYRPNSAAAIARAMIRHAGDCPSGSVIIPSSAIPETP
jgi:uncharacterized protein YbjT (DUF2867 family)